MNIEEGEYSSDMTEKTDFYVIDNGVTVTFAKESHATVTRTQANDLRAAYVQGGWSALRTAWIAIDSRAEGWLDGMTTGEKDGLIYVLSSRSALPTPP